MLRTTLTALHPSVRWRVLWWWHQQVKPADRMADVTLTSPSNTTAIAVTLSATSVGTVARVNTS